MGWRVRRPRRRRAGGLAQDRHPRSHARQPARHADRPGRSHLRYALSKGVLSKIRSESRRAGAVRSRAGLVDGPRHGRGVRRRRDDGLESALAIVYFVTLNALGHLAFVGSRMTTALFALQLGASPFTVGTLMSLFALLPML